MHLFCSANRNTIIQLRIISVPGGFVKGFNSLYTAVRRFFILYLPFVCCIFSAYGYNKGVKNEAAMKNRRRSRVCTILLLIYPLSEGPPQGGLFRFQSVFFSKKFFQKILLHFYALFFAVFDAFFTVFFTVFSQFFSFEKVDGTHSAGLCHKCGRAVINI